MNISDKDLKKYQDFVLEFLVTAEKIIYSGIGKISVNEKKDKSLVTQIDIDIESKFREIINKKFPTHSVIGEEFSDDYTQEEFNWVIDPIDGTDNLIQGVPFYANYISLYYNESPILGCINLPAINKRVFGNFKEDFYVDNKKYNRKIKEKAYNQQTSLALDNIKYLKNIKHKKNYYKCINKFDDTVIGFSALNQYLYLTGGIDIIYGFGFLWDIAAFRAIASIYNEYYNIDQDEEHLYFVGATELLYKEFKKELEL